MLELCLDDLQLLCTEGEVKLNGKTVAMPEMEKKLLLFFLGNPDKALSRELLLRRVWGYEICGATRTVDTHVKNLRARLGAYGKHIVTVRGVGYRLDTETGRQVQQRGLRVVRPDACTRNAS